MNSRAVNLGLVAFAGVQLAVLVLIPTGPPEVVRTRLFPELEGAEVSAISIAAPDRPTIDIELTRAGPQVVAPARVRADPRIVGELIAGLEYITSLRRAVGRGSDPGLGLDPDRARARILVTTAASEAPVELRIGDPAADGHSVWVARAGSGQRDAHAVSTAFIDLLPRVLDDVRDRHLLAGVGELRAVTLAGQGLRVSLDLESGRTSIDGATGRLRSSTGRRVIEALQALEMLRFDDDGAPVADEPVLSVLAHGRSGQVEIHFAGRCANGEGEQVVTAIGSGCVDRRPRERLAEALTMASSLIDQRLSPPGVVERVQHSTGSLHVIGERSQAGPAIDRWLDALDQMVEEVVVKPEGGVPMKPAGRIELTTVGGAPHIIDFVRRGAHLYARRGGETVLLRLADGAGPLIAPDPIRFRSLNLVDQEPTALVRALVRRGNRIEVELVRGELLEDWSAPTPAGTRPAPGAVERLRALADLTAVAAVAPAPRGDHRLVRGARVVELTFEAALDGGAEARVVLTVGRDAGQRCLVTMGADPTVFEVASAACDTFTAPLAVR